MTLTINDELLQYIDPLTANEYAALERSLLAEGCRDALVVWGDILVDGHNRYEICCKHQIAFKTVQNQRFQSLEDVKLWMIDNQLGRRSVSDFQRGVLALRKRDLIAARIRTETTAPDCAAPPEVPSEQSHPVSAAPLKTREDIARVAGISANTIGQIERIHKSAAPELVEAVRAGTISINAAAAVATLPSAAQISAVAGGRKELRQTARTVREQQAAGRVPRTVPEPTTSATGAPVSVHASGSGDDVSALQAEITTLRARVATLTAENIELRNALAALRDPAD